MKKYTKEEVIRKYEESGNIRYQCVLDGDFKTFDKEGKKLLRIFKYFEKNREFALDCIDELLGSKNCAVRLEGAAYCLALREKIQLAELVLQEISETEDSILGFDAKMTLQVWKEKGSLRIYQPKE